MTPSQSKSPPPNSKIRRFDLVAAILVSLTVGLSAGKIWSRTERHLTEAFHHLYYASNVQFATYWLGRPIAQLPLDMWACQEIIWESRPDVLLEMGTFNGGSALYFASLFDLIGRGRVITVDIVQQPGLPKHPRITYLLGSSTSEAIASQIRDLIQPGDRVMALLDSDHRRAHVLNELNIYSQIVTKGQYLVVADSNVNGHPVRPPGFEDGGPYEAVAEFLRGNRDYIQDRSREKFRLTFYPGGWLKRIR